MFSFRLLLLASLHGGWVLAGGNVGTWRRISGEEYLPYAEKGRYFNPFSIREEEERAIYDERIQEKIAKAFKQVKKNVVMHPRAAQKLKSYRVESMDAPGYDRVFGLPNRVIEFSQHKPEPPPRVIQAQQRTIFSDPTDLPVRTVSVPEDRLTSAHPPLSFFRPPISRKHHSKHYGDTSYPELFGIRRPFGGDFHYDSPRRHSLQPKFPIHSPALPVDGFWEDQSDMEPNDIRSPLDKIWPPSPYFRPQSGLRSRFHLPFNNKPQRYRAAPAARPTASSYQPVGLYDDEIPASPPAPVLNNFADLLKANRPEKKPSHFTLQGLDGFSMKIPLVKRVKNENDKPRAEVGREKKIVKHFVKPLEPINLAPPLAGPLVSRRGAISPSPAPTNIEQMWSNLFSGKSEYFNRPAFRPR